MKWCAFFLLFKALLTAVTAQETTEEGPIATRTLLANQIMKVTLSGSADAVLIFPAPVSFRSCPGLESDHAATAGSTANDSARETPGLKPGKIAFLSYGFIDQPQPDLLKVQLLEPEALMQPDSPRLYLTVRLGNAKVTYKIALVPALANEVPDLTVNYQYAPEALAAQGQPDVKAVAVSAKEVRKARPVMTEALYRDLENRAANFELLRPQMPWNFHGFKERTPPVPYTTDRAAVSTSIEHLAIFEDQDCLVLSGTLTNKQPFPIRFDEAKVRVLFTDRHAKPRWFHCEPMPIPPAAKASFTAILQGGPDGISRANWGIDLEPRLYLEQVTGESAAFWTPASAPSQPSTNRQ
jgi:hypothetical protein